MGRQPATDEAVGADGAMTPGAEETTLVCQRIMDVVAEGRASHGAGAFGHIEGVY